MIMRSGGTKASGLLVGQVLLPILAQVLTRALCEGRTDLTKYRCTWGAFHVFSSCLYGFELASSRISLDESVFKGFHEWDRGERCLCAAGTGTRS